MKKEQNHYGNGDNVGGDKTINFYSGLRKKYFTTPKWLRMTLAIVGSLVGILTLLWNIFIYYKPNDNQKNMGITQNMYGSGDNVGGDKITNFVVNQKEPSIIIEKRFVSTEAYKNGFETKFIIVVGNPPTGYIGFGVHIPVNTPISFIGKPIPQQTGQRFYQTGSINYSSFLISLFIDKALPPDNFTFSVSTKPQN
jgi:hypothetical protein